MNPDALVGVVRDAADIPYLRIALIVLGAWLLIRVLTWLLPLIGEALPAAVRIRVLPLVPALRLLITTVAVLWIVPLVIAPTPQNLVAVLGALGIALGFAFKDYAGSLVAGVVAVSERPYRQGDWVQIEGVYGEVRAVGLRALQIVTPDDDVVTFPHGVLWTGHVANANDGERTLRVVTKVWVAPEHDATRLRERLAEVVWTAPRLDVTRPIEIFASEDPWGTRYEIKAYPLEARDQFAFRTDLTVRAKDVVRAVGAQFPKGARLPPTDVGDGREASKAR